MGILNVTPDSFAETAPLTDPARAIARALELEAEGADIIDIGGESTRPGAEAVPAREELARVLPVVEGLVGRLSVPISVDTYKADVADAALAAGATIVNDISGLRYDPALGGVVAARNAVLVLMHTRGVSKAMYAEATYADTAREVTAELQESVARAKQAGIGEDRLILDPGLGFAKRAEHSYEALAMLPVVAGLDRPLLVGPSRKSFLAGAVGSRPPAERDWASAGAVAVAVMLGAHIVRVHNVAAMRDVVRVIDRMLDESH
jgi:dihydropteroate synthase